MMTIIAWLMVLAQRGWINVKFFFRNIALRFERMAYLARMFKLLREGHYTDEGFVMSIPCLSETPETVMRWMRELRDVTFYLGHRFDRRMAVFIVRECQELFRAYFLECCQIDSGVVSSMKRYLYRLAGQIKSIMTPISISESANFLLSRMYAVVHRTVAGTWKVEEEE
ncbi:MAG: hypothetical protein MUO31_13535 [Thermodesulfovibrionales bacterium]|nr:hypothetical protein [Thermodesulfovibrionales bacterium]